mgnify:FL=1
MTSQHGAGEPPHPDFGAVASESPAESVAHENEVVEHIAHEHDFPDQPSEHPVEEQLAGLVDPAVLRAEG